MAFTRISGHVLIGAIYGVKAPHAIQIGKAKLWSRYRQPLQYGRINVGRYRNGQRWIEAS